jgi:peroxiredoxin
MTKGTLCSVLFLATVALVGAQSQKNQAPLRDVKDRSASPSFRLADSSGKSVRLSDFRGKPVVLNFWATECGGCRQELPTFVALSAAYKNTGLTVVGVSMDISYSDLKSADEGWARVKPFSAAHGMTYQIVLDDGSAEKAFNVTALPATYLVDRSGRIAATYIGVVVDPANLEANIKTLLAER